MPSAEELHSILYAALISQAKASEFMLGDDAAHFVVRHALENIFARYQRDADQTAAALAAVAELPRLAETISAQTTSRDFTSPQSVVSLMRTCAGPYPWCTNVP